MLQNSILYTFGILFAMLIVYTFYTVYNDKTTTLTKFFSIIAGISAIAVSLNLIINTYVQMRDIYDRNQRNMIENSQQWSNILKICVENYPYSHRIYEQLEENILPDLPPIDKELENDPNFIRKRIEVELYISAMCIQVMENFLIFGKYDKGGAYPWIVTYLWWFNSPVLVGYWRAASASYVDNTVQFVESLIEVSKKMRDANATTPAEIKVFVDQVKFTYIE